MNILIYSHALVNSLLNFAIFCMSLDLSFKIMIFQFHIIARVVSFFRTFEHTIPKSHEPGMNIFIYSRAVVYDLLNFAILFMSLDLSFTIIIFQFHIRASVLSFDSHA